MIDRKQIEHQLASLERQQQHALQAAREAQEAAQQCAGGVQVCKHWLATLDKEEAQKKAEAERVARLAEADASEAGGG